MEMIKTLFGCVIFFLCTTGTWGTFSLFMDKNEVHRLLGLSSEIYLVREGVVNEYALNFVVNVPVHISHLNFKWQATTKKPVHYEMKMEFADFFALLQPSSNISNVGRLPHKLETFRISLPCSGRLTTEVPVIIKFIFHVKHLKHNVTEINVKRNKICLLKEQKVQHPSRKDPNEKILPVPPKVIRDGQPVGVINGNSSLQLFPENRTAPSLLLAGLLGACAVTASIVSVVFFIYLRQRLRKLDNNGTPTTVTNSSDSSYCNHLQYGSVEKFEKNPVSYPNFSASDKFDGQAPPPPPPPPSTNPFESPARKLDKGHLAPAPDSYSPFAPGSFWNAALTATNSTFKSAANATDVSPYAYAQIVNPRHRLMAPPAGHVPPPSLIEWYQRGEGTAGHIYANHLSSFTAQGTGTTSGNEGESNGGYENFGGRSIGSNSLIQVDGFQCNKNFVKDSNIIERFL